MAVVIRVNGNSAGDGFLIAPDGGSTFAVPLHLRTDDGSTVSASLDATPNGAGIALPGGTLSVGPAGMDIAIHATAVSNTRRDTVINVHVGATTTSFSLTAIANPEIWYRGRFEARFATDGDFYNNPRGNDGGTVGYDPSEGPGWTWALEGEPDFVPSGVDSGGEPNSVPTSVDKPVGRVVRLNNPVALRSHADPVVTTVNEIHGTLAGATTEIFTAGDPVLGATVNLGPNTYFAANYPKNPSDPWPAEPPPGSGGEPQDIEGNEPMALFEVHIDGFFSGTSATLANRPHAAGIPNSPSDERTAIGWVPLSTFTSQRLTLLQADYNALSPADQTGTVAGRNLKQRIDHLDGTKIGTLQQGWDGMEEYTGKVNAGLTFLPSTSAVLSFLSGYTGFTYFGRFFNFTSDELCGHVHGSLTAIATARVTKDCVFITDRNTFGKDEIDAMLHQGNPATIPAAFYIIVDGFRASELGITAGDLSGIPGVNPVIAPHAPVTGMWIGDSFGRASALVAQDPTLQPYPQRFTWVYPVNFSSSAGFIPGGQTNTLTASISSVSGHADIQLNEVANIYEVDGPISYLSADTRVFMVKENESWFNSPMKGGTTADCSSFIKSIISNLNHGTTSGQTFDSLDPTEAGSPLALYQQDRHSKAVFNFALSRVRYRSLNPPDPTNVRVFFRLCPALSVSVDYDATTTYKRSPVLNPDGQPIPVLGVESGNIVTIPFFAEDRKNTSLYSMDLQIDPANVQTVPHDSSGNEVEHYFGCWLDINQPMDGHFPLHPSGDGPYSGMLQSVFDLVRNQHQCLLTEIAFDPDPITGHPSPAMSDKLAQRNLSLVPSDNPGDAFSRRIPNTFELKPTPLKLSAGDQPDELMIDWGNTPAGSTAQIYLPATSAAKILDMARTMYATHQLTKFDDSTVQCPARGITYVPIPPGTNLNYAGLLTVDLPEGVRRGQLIRIVVRQVTNAHASRSHPNPPPRNPNAAAVAPAPEAAQGEFRWRMVRGSFQISIPVSSRELLLEEEEQLLSMLLWIEKSIPVQDRWHPVFHRYVGQIAQRVSGFGGDPGQVEPSPTGRWHHPKPGHDEERVTYTGKIAGLIFDRFGDFDGFVLDTEDGERTFQSREKAIEELARRAWAERLRLSVRVERDEPHRPEALIIREPSAHF